MGVTTHELLRLPGFTFRTDATIDRPLVGWLQQRQATADLRRLKQLLETPLLGRPAPEETPT